MLLQLALAVIAVPLVVLAGRDFWRGMTAGDADQFKAMAFVKARTAVVAFSVTAVILAPVWAPFAAAFLIPALLFQFAVRDTMLAPIDRTL